MEHLTVGRETKASLLFYTKVCYHNYISAFERGNKTLKKTMRLKGKNLFRWIDLGELKKLRWQNLLLLVAVLDLITIPISFVVLRQRLREIERGELDEARKY